MKGLLMKILYDDKIFDTNELCEINRVINNEIINRDLSQIVKDINILKEEFQLTESLEERRSVLKELNYLMNEYIRDFETFTTNISTLEKTLWQQSIAIQDNFISQISIDLENELSKNERYIHKRLEEISSLKSDFNDSTAKVKKTFFKTASLITNKVSSNNSDTMIETLINQYFSEKQIDSILKKILKNSIDKFAEDWQETIDKAALDSHLVGYDIDYTVNEKKDYTDGISTSEQAFVTGIGAAVIGTVGLAAGWHTLTYSLLNVFPPLLIFSAIIYPIVSILSKEKSIQKKKDTITRLKNSVFDNLNRIIVGPSNNGIVTISQHIKDVNKQIIEETITKSREMNFYNVSQEEINQIRTYFNNLLKMLNQSLISADIIIKMELANQSETIHLENQEIRSILNKTFYEAKVEIDIISPWMTFNVVNPQFKALLEAVLKRGVRVRILFGIGNEHDQNRRNQESLQVANMLLHEFRRYGDLLKLERQNTHYKLLICDNDYYVVGSYNFLSFTGNYYRYTSDEGADLSKNIHMIHEKRNHYFGHLNI